MVFFVSSPVHKSRDKQGCCLFGFGSLDLVLGFRGCGMWCVTRKVVVPRTLFVFCHLLVLVYARKTLCEIKGPFSNAGEEAMVPTIRFAWRLAPM